MTWADALAVSLNRAACSLVGRSAPPRLSTLIFHRVHARPDALFPHEVDAVHFDRMVRVLARSFRVMTLGHAAALLARRALPSRAVAITFDDGYADNADVALPILQRHGVPASFFVATGFLDGGRMWNDSIIECIRVCAADSVDLEDFGLGRYALATAGQRRACIEALLSQLKYLPLAEREAAVQRVQFVTKVGGLPSDLMMTSGQVRMLHRAGMEIGAHTVNHPILKSLTADAAERELQDGRRQLEQIIDAPVDTVAYPNGKPKRDYDQSHVAMVERLGFRAAVTTAAGVAQAGDDLFQLPRFTPWDRHLLEWSARLILNRRATSFDRA